MQREADDRLRKKASIGIPLLPENRDDERLSKLYRFQPIKCKFILFSLRLDRT